MAATTIQWTDHSINPIRFGRGHFCQKISPGCANCYASRLQSRFGNEEFGGASSTVPHRTGEQRNGAIWLDESKLQEVLGRKKPTRYFWCDMTDLFGAWVPDEWLDRCFAVMALTPHHTHQCLTKRAERMAAYCNDPDTPFRVLRAADAISVDQDSAAPERWRPIPGWAGYEASSSGSIRSDIELRQQLDQATGYFSVTLWQQGEPATVHTHRLVLSAFTAKPFDDAEVCHRNGNKTDNRLANLRWGSRSENQAEKVRHGANGGPAKLDRSKVAAIRKARVSGQTQQQIADVFGVSRSLISMIESKQVWRDADLDWPPPNVWLGVSVEDQKRRDRIDILRKTPAAVRFLSLEPLLEDLGQLDLSGIHWVIAGGESGSGSRPCDIEWIRSIVRQCREAGCPAFVKQLGSQPFHTEFTGSGPFGGGWPEEHWMRRGRHDESYVLSKTQLRDPKGGDIEEFPTDLRVREWPEPQGAPHA